MNGRSWLVLVTVPDKKTQKNLTSALLKERLAVCISAFPVLSQYRWQGKIAQAKEHQLLIKTSTPVEKLKKRISELHPYKVPEILAFKIGEGSANYLAWMRRESG